MPQTEEEEEKFVEVGGDSSIPLSPSLSRPQCCSSHIFPAAQKRRCRGKYDVLKPKNLKNKKVFPLDSLGSYW